MGVPSNTGPPPGSVGVGELFADAQTKMLWLGVPSSIDASLSVLVADIVGLLEGDDEGLVHANVYTDGRIATRAPTVHTHAIADVTGLQAALDALPSSLPIGAIVLWSGAIGTIPTGWALCDGTGGTVDLRGSFVMGGGGVRAVFSAGGSENRTITSTSAGAHSHAATAAATALTTDQIPPHTHVVTDPGHVHTVTDAGHHHEVPSSTGGGGGTGPSTAYAAVDGDPTKHLLTTDAPTGIAVASHATGITVADNVSANNGHTHNVTMAGAPAHSHQSTFDVLPPYVVLAYIQKIA